MLCASFLGLASLLLAGTANAQDNGSHRLWKNNYTPEQIKDALARLGGGAGEGQFDLDPFKDQILDMMKKQNPQFSREDIEKALEFLKQNPKLMEQAQKLAKDRQRDPGRPGQLTPDDIQKLLKNAPNNKDNPFGKFDGPPGKFDGPPGKIDPFGKVDPGKIDGPPGKIDGPPGKIAEPPPGKADPFNPVEPAPKDDKIKIDENPFVDPNEPKGPTKPLEALEALWEDNFGSLEDMPEVKKSLFDMLSGSGMDFDFQDENGKSFWDFLKDGGGESGNPFGDMGGGKSSWGDWSMPKLGDWFNWGGSSSSSSSSSSSWWNSSSPRPRPSSSSSSGSGGWNFGGFGGTWLPFAILGLVILAVFLWIMVKNIRRDSPLAGLVTEGGLGPWPIDPRAIRTREDVVIAFEYLSVLICGPSAKNWTHSTIAEALADLAETHGETAGMLARLYELARYAPLDEPLTMAEVIEARELVCDLAGVSY